MPFFPGYFQKKGKSDGSICMDEHTRLHKWYKQMKVERGKCCKSTSTKTKTKLNKLNDIT